MIHALTLNKNWPFFMMACSALLALQIGKRTHWALGAASAVFLFSGIHMGVGSFQIGAFALFAAALLSLDRYAANIIELLFAFFYLFSVIVTLTYTPMGASGNPSMNGCMIAILLPFAASAFRGVPEYAWIGISAAAIMQLDASIPVGVLFVVVVAGWWSKKGAKPGLRQALVMSPLFAIGYFMNPAQFLTTTGRWQIWKDTLTWWYNSDRHWFGIGTGALDTIFRHKLAVDPNYKTVIWAHNDYLQILFDNGIVGLSAVLIGLLATMRRAFPGPILFSAVCGYAATALFNFPMHVPLHAMVGMILVWMTWTSEQVRAC